MHKGVLSVREQIANQLRSEIINGQIEMNTKLKETELAQRFGVSRGPIRDTLLQLSKEGLLTAKNNCGVTVNKALEPGLQPLMIALRTEIESHAFTQVIEQLTDADFAELEGHLNEMVQAFKDERFSQVTESDIAFHAYLVNLAGGDELLNLWQPIVYRMRMNYKRVSNADQCFEEHNNIIQALKSKDLQASIEALKANIK